MEKKGRPWAEERQERTEGETRGMAKDDRGKVGTKGRDESRARACTKGGAKEKKQSNEISAGKNGDSAAKSGGEKGR